MRRTTISLPDELAAAVEREANRRAIPVSQVAREALSSHLGFGTAADQRPLAFAALGRSGRSTTARDMEDLLEAEWGARARRR